MGFLEFLAIVVILIAGQPQISSRTPTQKGGIWRRSLGYTFAGADFFEIGHWKHIVSPNARMESGSYAVSHFGFAFEPSAGPSPQAWDVALEQLSKPTLPKRVSSMRSTNPRGPPVARGRSTFRCPCRLFIVSLAANPQKTRASTLPAFFGQDN